MKRNPLRRFCRRALWIAGLGLAGAASALAGLTVTHLRCEYRENPLGIDALQPRLSWQVTAPERGQRQTAYRIIVASSRAKARVHEGDVWDSGIVRGAQTLNVAYAGRPLVSRQECFWRVQVWDRDERPSEWSPVAWWTMGLLRPEDWRAQWISYRDETPLPTNRNVLHLAPARYYRRGFDTSGEIRRATLYVSALGLVDFYVDGRRVSENYFEPGWADYHRRAYYRTHDVTKLLRGHDVPHDLAKRLESHVTHQLDAVVADGWYAGYVGFGHLLGFGPNRLGRCLYGKAPALLAQLEIEFTDGRRIVVGTDSSWQVSADGPLREADIIMGEAYDARRWEPWRQGGGRQPREPSSFRWESAVLAESNGPVPALFYDNRGAREVDLGFRAPAKLQAYPAPPIRVTQELPAVKLTEPEPGVYLFDLGQNFAGVIRLKVHGPAGTKVKIRYGEMLHPDGRLMTENLRKARATDFYILRGDPHGEVWQPRFTYHGFRYVELTGLPERPDRDAVTGLVLHNDTPMVGEFACSDEVMTRFWKNTRWTQRANFVEMPTDCPQRDERLGWMGDAQAYIGAACYNADTAAFYTKWLDDVEEAQLPYGAYPDYCPYPMGAGTPGKNFGTAWTDAGVICPWTVWQVYGDTRVIERHWDSMARFMEWRRATTSPKGLGASIGNPWGDWLNVNDPTPIEYIDTCYHALDCRMMAEMADAIGRTVEAAQYRARFQTVQKAFRDAYLNADGTLKVDSQTAHVLALEAGLVEGEAATRIAARLAEKIAANEHRMTTGFLGTKALLPALSAHGQHELAVRLFQSRRFPSWGYEVVNGATTVWERWDSYTREHGFEGQSGHQNAAMNSFSHYAFGAVTEWMFRDLAGIRRDGPGFDRLIIHPGPPEPSDRTDPAPISWVRARYDGPHGRVVSNWRREGDTFRLDVVIPANTTATVLLPTDDLHHVTESDRNLGEAEGVEILGVRDGRVALRVGSGEYHFAAPRPPA